MSIVSGVEKYIVGEDEVFIICNDETSNSAGLVELPFRSHKGYNPIFLTYKSSVFYSTYGNELCQFDGESKEEIKIKKYSGSLISNYKNIFVVHNDTGTAIIDVEKDTVIWEEAISLTLVASSSRFVIGKTGRKGKEVCVVDIKANTQFNIPLIAGLVQILNYRDESFLLLYEDGRMQNIDFLSKDEIWTIQAVNQEKLLSVKWHLSESENKAYLLVQNCLFELDLEEKESQLIKDYNESTEQEWYFKHSRLYNDYITFSGANVLGKFPMVAGVIDRDTKEILWTIKCEPGIYFEGAPQIKDNKLYILDSSQTLRIFKRE